MYRSMILLTALMHLCFALGLLMDPEVSNITSMAGLHLPGWWSVAALAATAVLSLYGLWAHEKRGAAAGLMAWGHAVPQQILLMLSAFGEIVAIIRGAYPDGYVPSSRWFIASDQSVYLLVCVLHTWAIVRAGLQQIEKNNAERRTQTRP